ncbi:MAG: hypothetical protein MUF64_12755 [Polyangiaceae bacterium]|nr:hypothetical protein [Polyangiaceae bacterium]
MAILVHLPDSLKPLLSLLDDLALVLDTGCSVAASDDPFDLAACERLLSAACAEMERSLLRSILLALDRSESRLWIDGIPHRPVGRHEATFYSLRGPLVLPRTLYRPLDDRNARTVDPVALRGAMVAKNWLPTAAEAMAFLVQQQPARDAAAAAALLGVLPYHPTSFDRVCDALGQDYATYRESIEQALVREMKIPQESTVLVVSLDRVSTPLEEVRPRGPGRPRKNAPRRSVQRIWKMSYCATVSLHDAPGKTLRTLRYGGMPSEDVASLIEGLRDDVNALLERRPDLHVSLICDGAAEMWNVLGKQLNEAELKRPVERLVDLWHLLEKVGKALRERFDGQRASAELHRWKMRLLNRSEAWRKLLAEVRSWGGQGVRGARRRDVPGEPGRGGSTGLHPSQRARAAGGEQGGGGNVQEPVQREAKARGSAMARGASREVGPFAGAGAERAVGVGDGASARKSGWGGAPCGLSRMAGRPPRGQSTSSRITG